MARIRKNGSRKDLAEGTPFPGIVNRHSHLEIQFQVGLHQLVMTQVEWEMVSARIPKLIKEFETGKVG